VTIKSSPSYNCKYCSKSFSKESTLLVHVCERKRRARQEKEPGVQFGLRAWLRFYEITQGSAKLKTYDEFAESSFYNAFVKFGRHIVAINAINPAAFIDFVIKENKKVDHWTKDVIYEEYLFGYLRKEHVQDAFERALLTMQKWADENNSQFNHYFLYAAPGVICRDISNGRISPWIIYNSASGQEFLGKVNEEQLQIIYPYIDPEFWNRKFKDYMGDTEWMKDALEKAGV